MNERFQGIHQASEPVIVTGSFQWAKSTTNPREFKEGAELTKKVLSVTKSDPTLIK